MIDGTHNTLLDIDPIKCAANKIIAVVVFDWFNSDGYQTHVYIYHKHQIFQHPIGDICPTIISRNLEKDL